MYWDEPSHSRRPHYLDLCGQTIERHADGLPVRVVNRSTIGAWVGDVRPEFEQLSVVHRADYARARLLLEYGGIWLDTDTIVFRPLTELAAVLDDGHHFAGYDDEGMHVGTMVGRRGSPLLATWAQAQDAVIDRCTAPGLLSWDALGSDVIQHAVNQHAWCQLDRRRISPVRWREWEVLLSRTYPVSRVLANAPYLVALYNARLGPELSDVSADDVLGGRTLLGRLLRVSLGLSDADSVDGLMTRFTAVGDAHRHLHRRSQVRRRNRQSNANR
jgi:hypothetical protein